MKIYIICPVRNVTEDQIKEVDDYVHALENEGHSVHYPPRDVNQDDETGLGICEAHAQAMQEAERIDIFWDVTSKGSHFDLGMAFISKKPLKLVKSYHTDNVGKSYEKVIKALSGGYNG